MQSLMVVEPFDVFEPFRPCVIQIGQIEMIRPFGLKRSGARFRDRVIPAGSVTAHAWDHLMPAYRLTNAITAGLNAASNACFGVDSACFFLVTPPALNLLCIRCVHKTSTSSMVFQEA